MKNVVISQTSYNALIWAAREFLEGLEVENYSAAEMEELVAAIEEKHTIITEYPNLPKVEDIVIPPLSEDSLSPDGKRILSALKIWRNQIAQDVNLPEFMILNNNTLLAIATYMPQGLEPLSIIKGMSEKKVERYGNDVIAIVNAFVN